MSANYQLRLKLRNRFLNLVQRRLSKMGVAMTADCEGHMDKMISIGLSRLEHQRALEKEDVIMVTEATMFRIMKDLYERAQALDTFPMVDARVFEDTKKRLSPLWPFF